MNKSSEIGLGGLIAALNELPWQSEAHEKAIFHALGFTWQDTPPVTPQHSRPNIITGLNNYRKKPFSEKKSDATSRVTAPPEPKPVVQLPTTIRSSQLNVLPPNSAAVQSEKPDWLDGPSGANPLTSLVHAEKKLSRASLLPALTHRGILGAALLVKKPSKTINIQGLIDELVKGRIPKELPFQMTKSLEHGCNLLLDYSDSMTAYWEDLSTLALQLENLLSKERLTIYEFDQDPNFSERRLPTGKSENWRFEPGPPILVASNLDITGQQRRNSLSPVWRKFIETCRKHKIPLLILIPWSPEFWPSGLGKHPLIIPWNQNTTAAMVYRLVGRGHELGV